MSSISFEAILIVILVVANGVFSMSELAVVTARRPRLQHRAERGSSRARIALELAESPDQFLSTIQIGITVVGTLAGAFGGLTISKKKWLPIWRSIRGWHPIPRTRHSRIVRLTTV